MKRNFLVLLLATMLVGSAVQLCAVDGSVALGQVDGSAVAMKSSTKSTQTVATKKTTTKTSSVSQAAKVAAQVDATKKTVKTAVTVANTAAVTADAMLADANAEADPNADAADKKSGWTMQKGIDAIKAALLSIYTMLKELVNRDNYTPSAFTLTTTIPFIKMVEGIPDTSTAKPAIKAVVNSMLKKDKDGKLKDPELAVEYDLGFSGSGLETDVIAEYLESLPEKSRPEFIPADPSVGFPSYTYATFKPKLLDQGITKFFGLLSTVSKGNNGFQEMYQNISRVRADTIFWLKMIFLLSMQRTNDYFKKMPLIKQMEFSAFEVMMLMNRLSNSINDEASTRGPNFDEKKPTAAGYSKKVYYTDPFGTLDRLLNQFHLESLFDPNNPDSIKKDISAKQYLDFKLSQVVTKNKVKLAVASVYKTIGGLPARIKAAKNQFPVVLTAENKEAGELGLFDRQYLVYALYDMCSALRYVQGRNAEETTKMLKATATDFLDLVTVCQKAYAALGDYDLPKDFIEQCLPSLRNGLTTTADNIDKQLDDMLANLKTNAAEIAKTGNPALLAQSPTVPEAAFDTTGQVPIPAVDWLRMEYAKFSKLITYKFEFDSGYVPELLKMSYGDALKLVFAICLRVARDLPAANALYMKTPEYAEAKAKMLEEPTQKLTELVKAITDAQQNNNAEKLKELQKEQSKLKAEIKRAAVKLKGKAISFEYPRVKLVDAKTKAVTVIKQESIRAFMIRELIKIFNRMPESTRKTVIDAMNRFTMSFGINMNDYIDEIANGAQTEADQEAAEAAAGNDELADMLGDIGAEEDAGEEESVEESAEEPAADEEGASANAAADEDSAQPMAEDE